MPRIAATSIEEHVRKQTDRIIAAARDLFAEQGFGATDMGQIATEVGLARNSLYRYYPNKDHILIACIQADMGPHVDRLEQLTDEYPEPVERIMTWLDMQFELATGPAHATMELISEIRDASVKLKRDVRHLHEAPAAVLHTALKQHCGADTDTETLAAMINGMTLAATARAIKLSEPQRSRVRDGLRNAVAALLS